MKTAIHPRFKLPGQARKRHGAFTLVEVLVSMAILLMMLLIITQVIDTAQKTWRRASSRLTQFREARTAFDTVTRNLAQATLNPYRVYDFGIPGAKPGTTSNPLQRPIGYVRTSDLGFVIGDATTFSLGSAAENPGHTTLFQAPLGYTNVAAYRQLNNLLCVRGYYVHFGSDNDFIPVGLEPVLQHKYRFRLYEFRPPTETNTVYTSASAAWATPTVADVTKYHRVVAENIVAMVLAPSFAGIPGAGAAGGGSSGNGLVKVGKAQPAPTYQFNSINPTSAPQLKNQLPASIDVTMIAMDEESAVRLQQQFGSNPPKVFTANFKQPSAILEDLKSVRTAMLKLHVNYRIFSSTVVIPAADN